MSNINKPEDAVNLNSINITVPAKNNTKEFTPEDKENCYLLNPLIP
jgi:hypothetical protein